MNGNSTVDRAVSRTKERYLNFGISSEDIVEKDVEINGYKGKQVTVKIPDGRIFIVNYIENNGNIYHISQEGLPEYQEELKKVVDTWLPDEKTRCINIDENEKRKNKQNIVLKDRFFSECIVK